MSQADEPELDDIFDEIAFQKVLLGSIDDSVTNRAAAEAEVREEIKKLEEQVRSIKRARNKSSQGPSSSSASTSRARPSNMNTDGAGSADEATANSASGYSTSLGDPFHSISSASSVPSIPNSGASLGDPASHPSSNDRKRTYSKHMDGMLAPPANGKFRRTSESPFGSEPASPASVAESSDDELQAFGNSAWMDKHVEKQKAEERRLALMKIDEDLARELQEASPGSATTSASTSRGPTYGIFRPKTEIPLRPEIPAFGTPTEGFSGRANEAFVKSTVKPPPVKPDRSGEYVYGRPSIKAESSRMPSMTSGFASPSTMHGTPRVAKPEPSYSMPGTYRDSSEADDSDIEIIPPTSFRDNRRHPQGFAPGTLAGASASQRSQNSHPHGFAPGTSAGVAAMPRSQSSHLDMALFNNNQPFWLNASYPELMGQPSRFGDTMNNLPMYGSVPGPENALSDMISRPGNNYDALRGHLGLPEHMNDHLDYIMNDPRKTHQDLQDLLENIRPDDELPPEDREGTPEGLVYPLYEHQKLALTWLKAMEEGNNKGGILADDMGLGKTISALALMLSRKSEDAVCKTNLIVGPVALVHQWAREIRTKTKANHRLSVCNIHGQAGRHSWDELRTYDVVLTTYGQLGTEYKKLNEFHTHNKPGTYELAPMKKKFPLLGPASKFYRVLLDEAQCIKNKNTIAAKGACTVQSKYRFCLTGTPMMNNVGELYSLIHFLRIKPYNEWSRFNTEFGMLTKARRGGHRFDLDNVMQKLRAVLKAIILRRVKTSLIDGKPIITLPLKTEEIKHVVFSEDEQAFYTALEGKTQLQFNKYIKAGTVGKNYSNVLVLLLRLRQACCHPHLIHDFEETLASEDMVELAKTLAPEVIERIREAEGAFECAICGDASHNPKIILPCGHDFCSECLAQWIVAAGQQAVAEGNEQGSGGRCPTCRGRLDKERIIDYSSFKKAHIEDEGDEEMDGEEDSDDDSDSDGRGEEESDDDDLERNANGDLRGFIVPDGVSDTDDDIEDSDNDELEPRKAQKANDAEDSDDDEQPVALRRAGKDKGKGKSKAVKKSKKRGVEGKKKEKKKQVTLAMLKKDAMRTKEAHRRYMRYLKKNFQPSAKLDKCVELLGEFQEEGRKTIVFSQFTSLLDLLQVAINEKHWRCSRYDGGMSVVDRNDAVVSFTESRADNIMLISLKAGNAGLNLVAASRVIILDPFWNPYIEMQAVDRAYRIGQLHEVHVHRILIEGTVEDRIIELQNQKRELVESALDEGANKAVSRLGVQQLAYLFGVSANSRE